MLLLVAGLTALISVNGAVAALLPVIVVIGVRLGRSPSQLLMPLVFGAHAGSMLALTGTPVNVIVSRPPSTYGGRAFGFFEFALVGIPLVVGTILIVLLFGERLLPSRKPRGLPTDFSEHARTLVEQYRLDDAPRRSSAARAGVAEVVIPPRSELVGDTVFPGMVTDSGDLVILAVQRKGEDSGRARRRSPSATSCSCSGTVGGARREPRRPQRPGRRLAGAGPPPGRPARPRRRGGRRRARRDGRPARDRVRAVGRRRACSRRARWCCSGW